MKLKIADLIILGVLTMSVSTFAICPIDDQSLTEREIKSPAEAREQVRGLTDGTRECTFEQLQEINSFFQGKFAESQLRVEDQYRERANKIAKADTKTFMTNLEMTNDYDEIKNQYIRGLTLNNLQQQQRVFGSSKTKQKTNKQKQEAAQ